MRPSIAKNLAIAWLAWWVGAAVLSPWLFFEKAAVMRALDALQAPSSAHFFGTDLLGRDLFHRVMAGSTVSLGVSVAAVALSLAVGTWLGAIAGYFGGVREKCILAATDLFLCFPAFFLILTLVAMLGPGAWNLIGVIALTGWMSVSRLVRAEVLSLKERDYVYAARALGAGHFRVLWKHIVPNAFGPIRVSALLGLSGAILVEAGLSFLGLGVQPPVPSWGNLLMDGKAVLGGAWWMIFFPGTVLFLTVLSLNTLGDEAGRKKVSRA